MKQYLAAGRYKTIILIFDSPTHVQRLPPHAPYYLGEAYRLRGEDADDRKAYDAYMQAVDANPDFAPTSRALGLWHMKHDNHAQALERLRHYLQLVPNAKDRHYIDQYIQQLQKQT